VDCDEDAARHRGRPSSLQSHGVATVTQAIARRAVGGDPPRGTSGFPSLSARRRTREGETTAQFEADTKRCQPTESGRYRTFQWARLGFEPATSRV
jgi:hypothetical protein